MKSPEVTATVNHIRMTDGSCVQFVAALARAGNLDVKKAVPCRSTNRDNRLKNREIINTKIDIGFIEMLKRENIKLTVHWDGKLMKNSTAQGPEDNERLVDRLPVVVTGKEVEKTLGVPKLTSSTGMDQMEAVWNLIDEYGLADFVVAFSFDTTSSNSGSKKGACVLLDNNFSRHKFNLACRHHIYEIFLGAAFTSVVGSSVFFNYKIILVTKNVTIF